MAVNAYRGTGVWNVSATTDIVTDSISVDTVILQNGATAGAVTVIDSNGINIFGMPIYLAANQALQLRLSRRINGFQVSVAPAGFVGMSVFEQRQVV